MANAVLSTNSAVSAVQDSQQKLDYYLNPGTTDIVDAQGNKVANQNAALKNSGYNLDKIPQFQGKQPEGNPNGNTNTVFVDKAFANSHDMQNPAYANYKVKEDTSSSFLTDNPDANEAIKTHLANVDSYNTAAQGIRDKLTQIQNGTYTNPETQNLINDITASFDKQIENQRQMNEAHLQVMTQAGIRSGRNMYAPEIEEGNLHKIAQEGIDKISAIQSKKSQSIAKAQAASRASDFANLYKSMQDYEKESQNETKAALDLHKAVLDNEKQAMADAKSAQTMSIQKQKQEMADAKSASYSVLSYLDSTMGIGNETDPEEIKKNVYEYAAANGYNPDALLNEAEKLMATRTKSYGSGPIGQFQFAKDHGEFTGSFSQWQDLQNEKKTRQKVEEAKKTLPYKEQLKQTPTYKELQEGGGGGNPTPTHNSKGEISSSKKGDSSGGKAPNEKFATKEMTKALGGVSGSDGYVSPEDYEKGRNAWIKKGLSPTSFDTKMKGFRNPADPKDYRKGK